ncbi:MAG: hypothetical protein IT337_17590 [Thermomicrobiales bacterium]|nr:hypothetical protein [Thermomicrobiales bacterium]
MGTTQTTIPVDWTISDPNTWTLSVTADAHLGYHQTGEAVRGYREVRLSANDLGNGDIEPNADHAEWWANVLTAKLDADVALLEASPEAVEQIADLIDERNDADDLEAEAAVCRRIVTALRG